MVIVFDVLIFLAPLAVVFNILIFDVLDSHVLDFMIFAALVAVRKNCSLRALLTVSKSKVSVDAAIPQEFQDEAHHRYNQISIECDNACDKRTWRESDSGTTSPCALPHTLR